MIKTIKISDESSNVQKFLESEEVEDLLYEFLRDRTEMTEQSYRMDLRDFFQFTTKAFGLPEYEKGGMNFHQIKRVHVIKYKNYLESNNSIRRKPYAPNTVNRKLSTVSSFFNFLIQREILKKNPVEYCIRPKRNNVEDTQAFTDREMRNLFDLVIEEAEPLHKAIILLLFTTGMRQNELRNIRLRDFRCVEGVNFLKYLGKGQKQNEIPIHPTTAHYINEYISWMKSKSRHIGKHDYLFQPKHNPHNGVLNKKLTHTSIGYIISKWARRINPKKRITLM